MFKITGPVLSREELDRAELSRLIQRTAFPEFDTNSELSKEEWARAKLAWENFAGPVKNFQNFAFVIPADKELSVWIEYDDGQIMVELFDDQDIDENREMLFTDPIEQIKAVKKTAPNAPCFCNSGKKFKRCHGRYP